VTLDVQFVTTGMMFSGGLALGALYDLYRVLTDKSKVHNWLLALLDIVFWLAGTALVFRMLYVSNQGEVRIFIFIALLAGILLYFSLLSPVTIRFISFMIKAVLVTIRVIKRTIELFIIAPFVLLYRFVVIMVGFIAAVAIFLYKVVLQLLYPFWRLLLWLLRPLTRWIGQWRWLKAVVQAVKDWWIKWI
jgi:spore cortex biosynthesis protein YabQ